jgi:hypothetical protein
LSIKTENVIIELSNIWRFSKMENITQKLKEEFKSLIRNKKGIHIVPTNEMYRRIGTTTALYELAMEDIANGKTAVILCPFEKQVRYSNQEFKTDIFKRYSTFNDVRGCRWDKIYVDEGCSSKQIDLLYDYLKIRSIDTIILHYYGNHIILPPTLINPYILEHMDEFAFDN